MASASETCVTMETDEEDLFVEDDYCVQYFGFHPQYFMNGMYNAISAYLQEAMETLNETILDTFKKRVSETELKEVSRKQGQIAMDRLDVKFDKAEIYLTKNIFSIPDNLVLPSDRLQMDSPCTEEEMTQLDQDIQDVTDRILAVKYANAQLQERWEEFEVLQQQIDPMLNTMDTVLATVSTESRELTQNVKSLQTLSALADKTLLTSS